MRQIRKGGPSRPPSLRKNINMDIFVYFFKLYSLWFSNFQVSFKQFVKYNALVMTISHIIIFLNNLLNIML
jgi:hypothetical protein